jgi:hypothetical protein
MSHDAYRNAVEPWAKRAVRERKVLTHVRWDGGSIQTETAKPQRGPDAEPARRSARGLLQGDLL